MSPPLPSRHSSHHHKVAIEMRQNVSIPRQSASSSSSSFPPRMAEPGDPFSQPKSESSDRSILARKDSTESFAQEVSLGDGSGWSKSVDASSAGGDGIAAIFAPVQEEEVDASWLDHSPAWDHFCSVLTSLYALFIIVFAVVVELSQKFTPDEWFSETLFFSYMYGAGIVFLLYCYLFKVHPGWFNRLLKFAQKRKWIEERFPVIDLFVPKIGQRGEGAGSLYLRLGTLCFGSSGIVLFCLEIFICHSDRDCFNYQLVNWLLAGMFTFIQMHFIFCNSRLIIVDSKNSAKLGTMHLLAVNIWTWLRFVLAKNAALDRPFYQQGILLNRNLVRMVRQRRAIPSSSLMESSESMEDEEDGLMDAINLTKLAFPSKVSSFNYFGDFATLLTTCIVEYSVIGAAIMVTLWRSIDENNALQKVDGPESAQPQKQQKNGKSVRIDCSASSGGLFAGLLFMIASLVSIGIHSFFSQHEDSDGALLVFRLSDMALFCCTLVGCSVGLFRMRSLQYHRREEQRSSSAEFLDEILLVIGLVGELIHSSTGVMCWIATQSERAPVKMEFYMLFVFITRIVQVVVQAVFILLARRLRALSAKARREKPGKQFVTFLLIANVSLFFFHTLEGMKSVFGATIATRRARPYAALIVGVAPLVVFYRFHSSVCLAEIWKHCYSAKNGLGSQQKYAASMASSRSNISGSSIIGSGGTTSEQENCAATRTMSTILSAESPKLKGRGEQKECPKTNR